MVSLWLTQTDFGGIFKIIQVYERYDDANKMQIEQHRVMPQTVPYSEQRNWKQQVIPYIKYITFAACLYFLRILVFKFISQPQNQMGALAVRWDCD